MTIRRLIATALLCACSTVAGFAGGPLYVAGVSGFNSSATGQPITWAGGVVNYYTDQGNLSPLLPGASADIRRHRIRFLVQRDHGGAADQPRRPVK